MGKAQENNKKNGENALNVLKNICICVIIFVIIIYIVKEYRAYAEDLTFSFKEVEAGNEIYTPMTDAMSFHFNITDYNAKDGMMISNSLHGPSIEDNTYNMQGYGRYHMQMQYNLCGFIKYCYTKRSGAGREEVKNMCSNLQSSNPNKPITYKEVFESSGDVMTGDIRKAIDNFWDGMSTKPDFDKLQDQYILEKYVLPAISKLSLTGSEYKKAFGKSGDYHIFSTDIIKDDGQLITALLTILYSDFYTADLSNVGELTTTNEVKADIKKGDLIPFLYNADVTEDDPREIAKYAYIAYINGFETAGRTDGFHYWEEEYEAIFGEQYNLSEEEVTRLQQKYDTMAELFSEDKGDRGSRLFGQTITTIIKSDYNIETQVSAVRAKIDDILRDFNPRYEYKDLIAKNYLMVKHMMDNDHIKDTIEDYEIGTIFRNESKLSQGQFNENNTNTALLSDFQLVTVSAKNLLGGRSGDTDGDGVSDGDELGPDPRDWTDITDIIISAKKEKTMYESESEYRAREASNFEITKEEGEKWEEFNDSIKVTWDNAITKNKVVKVEAKLYKYKSNPNLKDTDFDGLDDKEEKGKSPLNNNFNGSSMTTDDGDLKIDFNTDFRYLMFKDTKYNDELAQQSLIMSNLANGKTITLKQGTQDYGTMNIEQYMTKLGFKDIASDMENYDGVNIKYNIGYKTIDYYGKNRGVISIFIGGIKDREAYKKLVVDRDYIRVNNPYEAIAERLWNKVNSSYFYSIDDMDLSYCYWVSGKGIAGGVASEIAKIIKVDKDSDKDIYCYTFGSPITEMGVNASNYDCIKNIINEDDYLTKIHAGSGTRYGDIYNASIMFNFKYNYRNLTKNIPKYTGNYQKMNMFTKYINELRGLMSEYSMEEFNNDLSVYLLKEIESSVIVIDRDFSMSYGHTLTRSIIESALKYSSNKEIKTACSTKAYWTLAKCLEGLDKSTINGRKYDKTIEEADSESWSYTNARFKKVIDEMAKWYIENVYTYNIGSYGAKRENQVNANEARVKLSDGNVIRDNNVPQYIENEQQYQDEYKYRFKYYLDRASEKARQNRIEYMENNEVEEEQVDDIYTFYDVTNEEENAMYNVDMIKSRERVRYTGRASGDSARDRGYYICDELDDKKVYDDCSAFVSAVIYKYLTEEEEEDYEYDEWMTSGRFYTNNVNNNILNSIGKWFECYEGNDITYEYRLENAMPLQQGDILVRNGHVEFYIDRYHSFGWGETHEDVKNERDSKVFRYHFGTKDEEEVNNNNVSGRINGYYFYNKNKNAPGNREGIYTKVYRLKEEYQR